jgi:aquaporin Z
MSLGRRAIAELIGKFWLVFGGCGSAVLAATFPYVGIGLLGVALAFGLTVLTMAYAIGHVSGCHLNPAVSVGLVVAKRFPLSDLLPYVVAQLGGGIARPPSSLSSPAAGRDSTSQAVLPPTGTTPTRPAGTR